MGVEIRPEQAGDEPDIRRIHLSAFPNAEEADLVEKLRNNGHAYVSLVADMDMLPIGHILFSPLTFDPSSGLLGVGLHPLAVMPAHQKKGVGTRLIQAGLDLCKEAGYSLIVVMGEPKFYQRFGFVKAGSLGLANLYAADEIFLALELKPGALKSSATVKFAPEFAGHTPMSWRIPGRK